MYINVMGVDTTRQEEGSPIHIERSIPLEEGSPVYIERSIPLGEGSPVHIERPMSLEEEVHGRHHATMNTHHNNKITKKHRGIRAMSTYGLVAAIIIVFLLLAGIAVLTVWLVYRPHKPRFMVLGAAIISPANITTTSPSPPYQISTSMQFSVVTTNPNKRVSIFYDHLSAFVSYRNQMITQPTALPPLFHEKHTSVQFAPILAGVGVQVSPEVWYGLGMDEAMGVVGMRLVLLGRLKWKAGAITTAHYHVYVRCDVLLRLYNGFVGQVPLLSNRLCKVDV